MTEDGKTPTEAPPEEDPRPDGLKPAKSLVVVESHPDQDATRYRLLETVRIYAGDQLARSEDLLVALVEPGAGAAQGAAAAARLRLHLVQVVDRVEVGLADLQVHHATANRFVVCRTVQDFHDPKRLNLIYSLCKHQTSYPTRGHLNQTAIALTKPQL